MGFGLILNWQHTVPPQTFWKLKIQLLQVGTVPSITATCELHKLPAWPSPLRFFLGFQRVLWSYWLIDKVRFRRRSFSCRNVHSYKTEFLCPLFSNAGSDNEKINLRVSLLYLFSFLNLYISFKYNSLIVLLFLRIQWLNPFDDSAGGVEVLKFVVSITKVLLLFLFFVLLDAQITIVRVDDPALELNNRFSNGPSSVRPFVHI